MDLRETADFLALTLTRHGGMTVELRWGDILAIVVFKQDLFNPTVVIMEIAAAAGRFEVVEADCGGFPILTHILRRHLGEVAGFEEWWPRVTNPLTYHQEFAIYRRD